MPRYLTINTVIRKYWIESTRHNWISPAGGPLDESEAHSAETVVAFSDAVRSGFPDARITWAISWFALLDPSPRYQGIRETVAAMVSRYGDDLTFVPGGYFANVYSNREQINEDIRDACRAIEGMTGIAPRSLVAGFLAAENIAFLSREMGMHAVQGNIWSQFAIDNQDGDGSPAYPYYPSTQHFCKPAQGPGEFIDCLNLDGWTVDLVAARLNGMHDRDGVSYNSRLGVGPIETLHTFDLETGLREMKATTDAHFCSANVARNPFGWVTNNYEICIVDEGIAGGQLAAFGDWIAWIKRTWPDTVCPTIAGLGDIIRDKHPNNDSLAYVLNQTGSGIGASFADQSVTWFMNAAFRLGIVGDSAGIWVFDFTDYASNYAEPRELLMRNWSLLGEINQKQSRPQDAPVPAHRFLDTHPSVRETLAARCPSHVALLDDALG